MDLSPGGMAVTPIGWLFTQSGRMQRFPPVKWWSAGLVHDAKWSFPMPVALNGATVTMTMSDERWVAYAPLWMLMAAAGVLPGRWGILKYRRWRRPPGTCRACGYDLRATPGRCPECGTVAEY